MRLSRLAISNFRNFQSVDIALSNHALFVGENQVGKSNLIHAIRLVLDASLSDSSRQLRLEDFWDGLPRPLSKDDQIEIGEGIVNSAPQEFELPVSLDVIGGLEVGTIAERSTSRDLVSLSATRVQFFVIRIRFAA